jgi:hypothetical protein
MKQGLFLYGIHVPGDKLSVHEGIKSPLVVFADPAEAPLPRTDQAPVVAEKTADFFFFHAFAEAGFHRRIPSVEKWLEAISKIFCLWKNNSRLLINYQQYKGDGTHKRTMDSDRGFDSISQT